MRSGVRHFLVSCSRKRQGFTLIEMMAVTVVLLLLAGLSLPRFSGTYRNMILSSTLDEISSIMQYAQVHALMRSVPVRLMFYPQSRQYRLEYEDPQTGAFSRISGEWGATHVIPDSLIFESSQSRIDFFVSGEIQPVDIAVCSGPRCGYISTSVQYGRVRKILPGEGGRS